MPITRHLYSCWSLFCSPRCLWHAWISDCCVLPSTEVADGLCCVLTTPCLAQNTPASAAHLSPCTTAGSPVTLRQKTFDWKRASRCVFVCMCVCTRVHSNVCTYACVPSMNTSEHQLGVNTAQENREQAPGSACTPMSKGRL